jgi:ribosomal protein S10
VIKILSEENSKWDHWVMQTAERIVDMLDRNGKSLQGNLSDVLLVVLPRP